MRTFTSGHKKTKKSWPILCYLHGRRECARLSDKKHERVRLLTTHGPLKKGNPRAGATNNFIVVVPQVPCLPSKRDRTFNNWVKYQNTVRQIVESVREEYNGDRRRLYLTGFSLGGNGVFDIARAQSNFWAALLPVDPTQRFPRGLQRPIWLWYGDSSRRHNQRTARSLRLQDASANKKQRAVGDRLFTDTAEGHSTTATSAFKDPRVYAWLLTKRIRSPTK